MLQAIDAIDLRYSLARDTIMASEAFEISASPIVKDPPFLFDHHPCESSNVSRISGSSRWVRMLGLLVVLAAFLVPARAYVYTESYYVDEAVFLSGLTLNPVEVTRWLTWHDAHRFNVPPDRAPPVSYWAAWVWSQVFGVNEIALRWWGVLCVGIGLIFVFEASRRAWGFGAALASGLLMALSPNIIVYAVNIRPYPFLLMMSAIGWFCLVQLLSAPAQQRARWLFAMALASLVAMYAHFFGVVLAGALFSGAIAVQLAQRSPVKATICAGVLVMSASAGLWPFVTAAIQQSGASEPQPPPELSELVRYVYRSLFGHPAMAVSAIALGATSGAFVMLGFLSLWPKRRASHASYGLLIGVLAGMTAAVGARFFISTFDSLAAWYNLWRVPAFAMLLGSALAVASRERRIAAMIGVAGVIAGSAFGTLQLMTHGDHFQSGPHRRIANVINKMADSKFAIIHDGGPVWGEVYFPIHFAYQDTIEQYVVDSTSGKGKDGVLLRRLPNLGPVQDLRALPHDHLIVIRAQEQGWRDLSEQIRHGDRPFTPGPALRALESSNEWHRTDRRLFVAQVAAELHVFSRSNIE